MYKIINPWIGRDGFNCFGCCPTNNSGLKMEVYEDGDYITAQWTPGIEHQSWKGVLHGGIQATLMDEVAGWVVVRKLQTTGVTSKMEIQYLKPVSTNGGPLTIRAHIAKQMRNVAIIEAEIINSSNDVCAKSQCTYFCASKEKAFQTIGFTGCDIETQEK